MKLSHFGYDYWLDNCYILIFLECDLYNFMANVPFYIFEDDDGVMETLKRLVSKVFPNASVLTANDGVTALNLILRESNPSIAIVDYNLPGINGIQMIKKIKTTEIANKIYFIVVSSSTDKDLPLKIVQAGADDFLLKPFSLDQLILRLRTASKVVNSDFAILESKEKFAEIEQKLLSQNESIKNTFIELQNSRFYDILAQLTTIKESSIFIAKHLCDDTEIENIPHINLAAELCNIGRLGLSEKNVNAPVLINGLLQNPDMMIVPQFAKKILSPFNQFDKEAEILYHIYENYDGSGVPNKLQAWKIPLGSRILRVAIDFEYNYHKNQKKYDKTMEMIDHEINRLYDHKVVAFYDQYHANRLVKLLGTKSPEIVVPLRELESGMIITRSVYTSIGLKLVTSGTNLNDEKIERIKTINATDNIIGDIYVRNNVH